MSLQQSTAASIIRPSQPRTNRPCFGLAKLFLISCSPTGEKKCISFSNEIEFLGSTYKSDKTKNLLQIIGNNLAAAAFWICQKLEFKDNSDEFNTIYRLFHESIDISKPPNISHKTTVRMQPVDSLDDHSQAIQGIQDRIQKNKNIICLTYEKFHD